MVSILFLFFFFSPAFLLTYGSKQDCSLDPTNPACSTKSSNNFADPPAPVEIPERIKKFCEADPTYEFCVMMGLGKKTKFHWSESKNSDESESQEVIPPADYAYTRSEEWEEEEKEKKQGNGKIDCEEEDPWHPGCLRNKYLDKFIAWKIEKDCEVDPNGPFCKKTLSQGCGSSSESSESSSSESESSSESSESTSSESEIPAGAIPNFFPMNILSQILSGIREVTKNGTSTAPEASTPNSKEMSHGNIFIKMLKELLEMVKASRSSESSQNRSQSEIHESQEVYIGGYEEEEEEGVGHPIATIHGRIPQQKAAHQNLVSANNWH